jgi:membrane protease YdiL (CAAX protease family)
VRRVIPAAVAGEAALLGLALGLGWWSRVPPLGELHWSWRGLLLGGLATLPLLAGLHWSLGSALPPIRRLVELARERLAPLFVGCSTPELGLVALAAGVGEEALFRGWLQPWLSHWMPPWAAVGGTAVLFGAAHPLTPTYAALAALAGCYLGVMLLLSGNLLLPITAHALYDLVALSALVRLKPDPSRHVV